MSFSEILFFEMVNEHVNGNSKGKEMNVLKEKVLHKELLSKFQPKRMPLVTLQVKMGSYYGRCWTMVTTLVVA